MSATSYKILVSKRLAIDPAELLSYYELNDHVLCTTPDGRQHFLSKADLAHPREIAKKTVPGSPDRSISVAETPQKAPGSAGRGESLTRPPTRPPTKKVAKPK